MADRDPKDMEPAAAGQLATETAELTAIAAAVDATWREHVPETLFVPPAAHPICGLLLMMRRVKRGDLPGLRAAGSPEMQRYVEALRTMAELAPGLHNTLAAELAEATPHVVRTGLEDDNAAAMNVTLSYLAGARNYACEALAICEAVVRHGDPRRHWQYFGLRIGPIVVQALCGDATLRGVPTPAISLRNPQSLAVRLSIALLAGGGTGVSADAFAALHKTLRDHREKLGPSFSRDFCKNKA